MYDGRVLDKLNCERDFVAAFQYGVFNDKLNCERDFVAAFQYGVLTWVRLLTF